MAKQYNVTAKMGAVKASRKARRQYVLMRILTLGVYGGPERRARRILRSLEHRDSDDPLVAAFNEAKARGELGDMTFHQFTGCARRSWRDRRIDARIERLERRRG